MSPTQLSLREMRKRGYLANVVERWIPQARKRSDLFGFIDVLCVNEKEVVGIQATSASNVSARVKKITDHENTAKVRKAGIKILVHGWGKRTGSRFWQLREVDCS